MSEELKPCEHCPTLITDEVRNGVELQPFVECSFCAKEFHLPLPPEVEAVLEAATELCHDDHWGNNNCCQCNLCVAVLAWIQKDKRNEKTQ